MFKRKVLSVAIAISLSTTSPTIYSLGVGNNSVPGILNRPLNIELPLIAESFELHDLKANLADDQQHERFGLIYPTWMPKLNFEAINSQQGPVLKVTSFQPIKEPIVNFVLEIKYKQVILFKEITLFLDPVEMVKTTLNSSTNLNSVASKIEKPVKARQSAQIYSEDKSPISFRVERGQSLWKIARNWQIDNVNLNQKMQAIFLSNQDAFINADKNKLKQGVIINLSRDSLNLVQQDQGESVEKEIVSPNTIEKVVKVNSQTQTQSTSNDLSAQSQTSSISQQQLQSNNQIENELLILKDTISQQQILNLTLKAELERLEQQIELKEQLILAQIRATQTLTKLDNMTNSTPSETPVSTISVTPDVSAVSSASEANNISNSSNSIKENTPINLWLTAIWFGLAIVIAYLGTIISGKRNAKKFAKKLDEKLQDLAYNKQKQLSQTPSVKELSIPKNLSTSVQIKYLNSAADFYIRCHRHDLAKELVNEGLIQFRGNTQIIDTLNQIRKRIFNQLDNEIHAHIVEKLDAREAHPEEKTKIENTKIKDDNIIDIEDFNSEWLKKWGKKVS